MTGKKNNQIETKILNAIILGAEQIIHKRLNIVLAIKRALNPDKSNLSLEEFLEDLKNDRPFDIGPEQVYQIHTMKQQLSYKPALQKFIFQEAR